MNLNFQTNCRRNCYFEGEKKLKFFKSYSLSNCMADCQARITFDLCGCAFFANMSEYFYCKVYHIINLILGEQDITICGYPNNDCFNKVMAVFEDKSTSKTVTDCKCLPSCYLLEYEYDVVQGTINRNYSNQLILFCH